MYFTTQYVKQVIDENLKKKLNIPRPEWLLYTRCKGQESRDRRLSPLFSGGQSLMYVLMYVSLVS